MAEPKVIAEIRDDDGEVIGHVLDSMVSAGDISRLDPAQRKAYYAAQCRRLRLDVLSKPFDFLRLNGKEVLYLNKTGTDQLARVWNVTRRLKMTPQIVDVGGVKLAMCIVVATLDGREEECVATCPLTDPVNVLMKVETKGKRRATLAILGAGMLDESEVDDIPAESKAPPQGPSEPKQLPPPVRTLRDLTDDHVKAVNAATTMDALQEATMKAASELPRGTPERKEFMDRVTARKGELATAGGT